MATLSTLGLNNAAANLVALRESAIADKPEGTVLRNIFVRNAYIEAAQAGRLTDLIELEKHYQVPLDFDDGYLTKCEMMENMEEIPK